MSKWIFLLSVAATLFLASCGKPSAAKYAEKFCACSEDLAKAEIQLKNQRIDAKAYALIKADQKVCMGEGDPRSNLKTSKDSLAFEAAFLEELKTRCPNIARNYGFEVD